MMMTPDPSSWDERGQDNAFNFSTAFNFFSNRDILLKYFPMETYSLLGCKYTRRPATGPLTSRRGAEDYLSETLHPTHNSSGDEVIPPVSSYLIAAL